MTDDFEVLKDDSLMPGTGKHAGKKMVDVPAYYLVWCYEQGYCSRSVTAYVVDNLKALKAEAEKSKREGNKYGHKRPEWEGGRIDYAPRKRRNNGRKL